MPAFVEKFSDAERDAVIHAYADPTLTAQRVADLAAAGKLKWKGELLPPFDIAVSYIRALKRRQTLARTGKIASELAQAPPRDAIEALRVRLINGADKGIAYLERRQARAGGKVDSWEEWRQAVRVVREAAALPGPTDPRPLAPGQREPGTGKRAGAETTGGMAHKLLADHARTAPNARQNGTQQGHSEASAAHNAPSEQTTERAEAPGSAKQVRAEQLAG